jgi:hypothetical protein
MKLNISLVEIGSFWLLFVGLGLLMLTMLAFGASAQNCRGITQIKSGLSWIQSLEPEHWKKFGTIQNQRNVIATTHPYLHLYPLSRVIIDTLHLYLQICDNLIQLLIRKLKVCDAIDKKKTFTDNFARNKYKYMAGYESYLQNLGILFHFYVSKESKLLLDYRDLIGPEKVKLLGNIQISSLLPNSPDNKIIQQIWNDFRDIGRTVLRLRSKAG